MNKIAEYLWALAVTQDGSAVTTKCHCFERPEMESLCKRYNHNEWYTTDVPKEEFSKEYASAHACKKCYKKWIEQGETHEQHG